jgi:hypothetical protein
MSSAAAARSPINGLHHHDGNNGRPFDEAQTGLDHIAMNVPSWADLDAWAAWLDSQGCRTAVSTTRMIRFRTRP